jgi:hypothetical protein
MRNRNEISEKPETKSRLKSQPGRNKLQSTIINISSSTPPFKKTKTERNPSNANGSYTQ